jgi:HK97 gp10 family phage protein
MAQMKNLEKRIAQLQRLPEAVQAAAETAFDQEVAGLVAAFKRACPVSDLEVNPGELRDSIESYPVPGRPLSARIIVGAKDAKGVRYARYVEFGHTSKGGAYVPAQPFFWPTYRARKKEIRRRMLAPARKVIRQLFPKV